MKIKEKLSVSTLEGEKLAEWVARAQGWAKTKGNSKLGECEWYWNDRIPCFVYRPDINGGQAMELAKKFGLIVNFEIGEVWKCGRTYPIVDDYSAICRAVVASVFGEEVDDDVS